MVSRVPWICMQVESVGLFNSAVDKCPAVHPPVHGLHAPEPALVHREPAAVAGQSLTYDLSSILLERIPWPSLYDFEFF